MTMAATAPQSAPPPSYPANERRPSIEKIEDEKIEIADGDVAVLEAGADGEKKKGDYSGFTQKTDPQEIKLVRKLDWYIMVSACDLRARRRHQPLTASRRSGACTG